jgi:hypothetical protein
MIRNIVRPAIAIALTVATVLRPTVSRPAQSRALPRRPTFDLKAPAEKSIASPTFGAGLLSSISGHLGAQLAAAPCRN